MSPSQSFHRLVSSFPCMTPSDISFRNFSGFLPIRDREYRVSISADCTSFSAEPALKSLLAPCLPVVRDRLRSAADPHDFLVELRDLAERQLALSPDAAPTDQPLDSALPPAHFYERLLVELSRLGWSNVSSLSPSMRSLDLLVPDPAGRPHIINLAFPSDYPLHAPKCTTGLPVDFVPDWPRDATLLSVRAQFARLVARFQDFFRAMDDLDAHARVLEPERPTTRDTYRRVVLGRTCSMRVELDARAPLKGFPEIRFLGSEAAIAPFKERLNRNIQDWDMSGWTLPRENLERVLEVTLPRPEEDGEEDGGADGSSMLECGICYAYRLEEAVPDVACDLAECSKPYHRACLVEWLRALPDTRESFGTMVGRCVYCEQSISVSVSAE